MHALYDATDTDLRSFAARGGRLILWHGWSDPHISPINTIAYFEAVQKELGAARTGSFARLFLFPGMYHCSGGDSPSQFDILTPLMRWVERGSAPAEIIAGRPVGMPKPPGPPPAADAGSPQPVGALIDRTRPIYPYPAVATYRGSGSIDDAKSFMPKPGMTGPETYDWMGRSFMTPGFHRDCVAKRKMLECRSGAWGDG